MTSFVGFVAKINKVTKNSAKTGKPFTLWSFRATDKDGQEIDHWFNCAFDKPDCQEGDYIKFDAEPSPRREGNYDVSVPSIKVSKNPPANPAAKKSGACSGGRQSGTPHQQHNLDQRWSSHWRRAAERQGQCHRVAIRNVESNTDRHRAARSLHRCPLGH